MKGCPTLSWELLNNVVKLINIVVFSMEFETGGATGGGYLGHAPLLHFILWLRTCLLIEAQHILHLN